MDDEDDYLRKKEAERERISLDTNWKKEQKKKRKEIKKETSKIQVREKDNTIKFSHKRLGSYRFNFLQRNILFSLLAMPLEDYEFDEEMDQPVEILEKNINILLKDGIVENLATVRKKKFRGDKHLHLYWRLTAKGEEISKILIDWFTELEKKKIQDLIE